MGHQEPRVDRALESLLLDLADPGEGVDSEQQAAALISKVCGILKLDVLYTVLSNGTVWIKTGYGTEGGLGRSTITRPSGIIRHVVSKKTRILQQRVSGRGTFHRHHDGWPGTVTASYLAVPVRNRGSIEGVLVLLRGPDRAPFDLEEFDRAELVAQALAIRRATGRTIERLARLARTDEATGLPNDRAARQALEGEVERARRLGERFSIARIRVAGFDRIRARRGRAGDVAFASLAKSVAGTIRGSDFLARLSADEMMLVLPETSREGMIRLMARIDAAIRSDDEDSRRRTGVTFMFEGAAYPDDGADASTLLAGLRPIAPAALEAASDAAARPQADRADEKKEAA